MKRWLLAILLAAAAFGVYKFVDWPAQPAPKPAPAKPRRPHIFPRFRDPAPSVLPPHADEADKIVASAPIIVTDEPLAGADSKEAHWFGYTPDERSTDAFVASLRAPNLTMAAPQLVGANEPVFLWRYRDEAYKKTYGKKWVCGRQGIGDCVSWGWACAVDISVAIDFIEGKSGEWKPAATEAIYGGSRVEARGRDRAGRSDGSNGGWAAKFVRDYGVLWRQPYEKFDLTTYSAQRAKDWGDWGNGGQGDDGWADRVAREHPVQDVTLCRNWEEAVAAISNGYPIPVCSGAGFEHQRDQYGEAAQRGSWAHCMCLIGYRPDMTDQRIESPPGSGNFIRGPPAGICCQNSWGPNWIRGPKWPADQPDGSFWIPPNVINRMLSGEDSFSVSTVKGFPRRKLRHGAGWLQ